MKKIALFLALTTIFAISCKKDKDTEKPVITIEEPSNNDTISLASSEIHMEFKATDNEGLHEVSVNLTNPSGTSLFSNTKDVDDTIYFFHEHITPSGISSITQLMFKVDASDHNENNISRTIIFYVKP